MPDSVQEIDDSAFGESNWTNLFICSKDSAAWKWCEDKGFAVIEDGVPVALGSEVKSSNIRMEGSALIAAMEILAGKEGTGQLQPAAAGGSAEDAGLSPVRGQPD